MDPPEHVPKKRNRISRVCAFCKRRKIKCDRGSPCLSCVKYGNRNCYYAEIEHHDGDLDKNGDLENTLESLKDKLRSLEEYVGKANNNSQQGEEKLITERLNLSWSSDIEGSLKVSPMANDQDYINFFEGYTSVNVSEPVRRRNFGPLSWFALIKVDGALGILWEYIYAKHESYHDKVKKMFVTSDPNEPGSRSFANRIKDDEGFNDVRDISYINPAGQQTFNIVESTDGLKQRHIFSNPINDRNEELQLILKIKNALPSKKVIWLLYKRFFFIWYTFIPCLDEVVLKEQIIKLIGEESAAEEPVLEVKVTRRLDFAHLGALLLVLRFGYLSLFNNLNGSHDPRLSTNDPSPKVQELKFLLSNPVGVDVVEVAHECLNQFNLMRGINMSIMQLALLTRFYHMYAPEDGDGADGGDAQVFNAMLIQMAYALGLHRDPDQFPDQCIDEKSNNLARKMWYCVLLIDLNNTMTTGTSMNVMVRSFDTKVPFYKPGNENVVNVSLEKYTVRMLKMLEASFERSSEMMSKILDVRGSVSIKDLEVKLEFMKEYLINLDSEILEKEQSDHSLLVKLSRSKVFLHSSLFLVSIYLHIFNYYERRRDTKLAYHFLKKMLDICIGKVLPFYFDFHGHVNQFTDATDLVIAPSFEQACHKSVIVLTGVYIRVKIITMNFETAHDHNLSMKRSLDVHAPTENAGYQIRYQKWVSLTKALEKSMKLFREYMALLSPRFYYAWRITKAQKVMSNLLTDEELFNRTRTSPKLVNLPLDNDMLDELNKLFDDTFSKIAEIKKEKNIKLNRFHASMVNQEHELSKNNDNSKHRRGSFNAEDMISNKRQRAASPSRQSSASNSNASGIGSAPSSVSSDSIGENPLANDEIDKIWMSMLFTKKSNDQTGGSGYYSSANFAGGNNGGNTDNTPVFTGNVNSPSKPDFRPASSRPFPATPINNMNPSGSPIAPDPSSVPIPGVQGLGSIIGTPLNTDMPLFPSMNWGGDPLDGMSIEDIFKDFN